jgi:hypothetical protein
LTTAVTTLVMISLRATKAETETLTTSGDNVVSVLTLSEAPPGPLCVEIAHGCYLSGVAVKSN